MSTCTAYCALRRRDS